MGLLGIGVLYHFMGGTVHGVESIEGFAMGGSSVALFSRVGGGIFTKSADVGADLVGKVEAGIPEDDPRNQRLLLTMSVITLVMSRVWVRYFRVLLWCDDCVNCPRSLDVDREHCEAGW